jgi:signal transduction histidine kinase
LKVFFFIFTFSTLAQILKRNLKIKLLIFFSFALLFFNCSKDQKSIHTENTISDSVTIYISLAENNNLSYKTRFANNIKALKILKYQENSKYIRNELYKVANVFSVLNCNDDFKITANLLLQKSISEKDTLNIAKTCNLRANNYIDLGKNDSSYIYFVKAEKLFHRLKDSVYLGRNYIEKAYVQVIANDFVGCEQSSSTALGYLKNQNDFDRIYYAYNYIGICSNELKNYDNALKYHNKALNLSITQKFTGKFHHQAVSLNNIGIVYQNLNNHVEAIKSFAKALNEKDLINDNPDLYAKLLDNVAYSKLQLKDYNELPELFFKSYNLADSLELPSGIMNKIHLSEYFALNNDTLKSQRYAEEALKQSKIINSAGDILNSLKQLSSVDKDKSNFYYKQYIRINDSIQQAERKIKDKFARIQFETDEIIEEKGKLEEQNRNLLFIFFGSFVFISLMYLIRTQRAKTRELLLKQAQQKANEEIYNLMISQQTVVEESRSAEKKRIAQELHDGVLGRLFGARLNLDSLNYNSDEESIHKRIKYLAELKEIEQDIREISHDLSREKYVLINNFVVILNNLLEEQRSAYKACLKQNIDSSIQWGEINNTIKINLYRIIQEGLQNINKYAEADNINIDVKLENDSLMMLINDDGKGFGVHKKNKGIGLQNMISRTQECKGVIDIISQKDIGTKILITIPLEIPKTVLS